MIDWYLELQVLLRSLRRKVMDGLDQLRAGNADGASRCKDYAKLDYAALQAKWTEREPAKELGGDLLRHLHFGEEHDYVDILYRDLPKLEEKLDQALRRNAQQSPGVGLELLLHPIVREHAYGQFEDGYLREAVLNAFVAVFDLIRQRTEVDLDGVALVGRALSLQNPVLILSELESESGQNDQKGFSQILQGAYVGIRNPKAHTVRHELTKPVAAQYLVFASLLARRISEASCVGKDDVRA